jgi:hypothetical protein
MGIAMELEFRKLRKSEILQAAELAARSFDDYEYFTNSKKNLDFYLKRGYEVFDERGIDYNGKTMGSWSLKKTM